MIVLGRRSPVRILGVTEMPSRGEERLTAFLWTQGILFQIFIDPRTPAAMGDTCHYPGKDLFPSRHLQRTDMIIYRLSLSQ